MRSLWRTAWPALLRDVALVCLAVGIVGVTFGATCAAATGHARGLPWWVPVMMSALVFAGGAQIAAVGVVVSGGSPVAAVIAGAVLNTRLLPYGFAVADVVAGRSGAPGARPPASRADGITARLLRGTRLLAGAHLLTDESVAFALRQPDPARRRTAFWACGASLFAVWNASVLLGVIAGSAVRDTGAFGLDATFPAVLLALALPALTSRPAQLSAGTGAVIAVALTPVLPAGLPLLAALGGLAVRRPRRRAASAGHRRDTAQEPGRPGSDGETGGLPVRDRP